MGQLIPSSIQVDIEDLIYVPEKQKRVTTEFSQATFNRSRELGWNTPDRKLPEVPPLTFGKRIKQNPLLRRAIEVSLFGFLCFSIYEIYENWEYFFNSRSREGGRRDLERNLLKKDIINNEKSTETDRKVVLRDPRTPLIYNFTAEENRLFVTFLGSVLTVLSLSVLIHRFRFRQLKAINFEFLKFLEKCRV